jgi:capsular polysaccharide biosynthesis protein
MEVKGVGIKEFLAERPTEDLIVDSVSKGQRLKNIVMAIAVGATIGGVFIFIDSYLG